MPLRFPRPVMALIATGTAAISIGLSAVPASADQLRQREWWLSSQGVTAAWAASQGSGVTVAVLSDGVVGTQPDLAGAVTTAPAIAGAPVASGQYAGEQGTAIASLIAGRGHGSGGSAGVVGVAPKARVLSVSVTLPPDDPQLAQSSVAAAIPGAIAAGIRYAVNHGATVIDLPIDPGQASKGGTGATAAAGGSAAEQAAVSLALAHNVVLVAPAGDDETAGDAPNYPAAYQGVIAVGAFNSAFTKAPWSSHQRYVTVTAAGAGVLAADNAGGYRTMNSTSAASAVVAGVASLIRSRYPGLTVADVRKALITSTMYRRAGGPADGSGYGAVNAGQAMQAAAALAAPPLDRASAGAQPRRAPAAVPAPSAAQSIGAQILRAGEISGGLLLLLLLLIAVYAATGRRRRGRSAVAAEWTHRQGQSRYPQAGGTDPDRMIELLTAPAPPPAPIERYAPQPAGVGNWAGGADEGLFAPAAGRQPTTATAGQPAPGAADESGGRMSHGPASRAVSRRAAVSGTPPWEPASAPDSELPWTAAPDPADGAVHPGGPAHPGGAVHPGGPVHPGGAVLSGGPVPPIATVAALPAVAPIPSAPIPAPIPAPTSAAAIQPGWDASARPERPERLEQPERRVDWTAPSRTSQPGWDRAARAGSSSPAGSSPPAAYRSPAGFSSATGQNGTGDFGNHGGSASTPNRGNEPGPPPPLNVAPSGLPVRQPRPARSASPAPLSPSGSLWEPVDSGAAREAAKNPGESQDAAGRPIFVWNPVRQPESRPARPGE